MKKLSRFSASYKETIFTIWYKMGRESSGKLVRYIPDEGGNTPSVNTLNDWISKWNERADDLDRQAMEQLDSELVQTKVDMLRRHSETAQRMQSIAVGEIEKHLDDEEDNWITSSVALRMLTEGIRIERETAGIPGMLEKIANQTDEEVLDDIKSLVEKGYKGKKSFDKPFVDDEVIDGEFA